VEVNCETDFVTKNQDFIDFSNKVADLAFEKKAANIDDMADITIDGTPLEEVRKNLIVKIGENITVRRVAGIHANGTIGAYAHGIRIAALVDVEGGNAELPRDIAMHIAASNPVCVDASGVPAELLQKERDIFTAQAQESGRPADIQEKMIEGRIRKYLEEVTLVGQAFVKDPDMTIDKLLKSESAKVNSFVRLELGEGVEIVESDFAAEVMEQLK